MWICFYNPKGVGDVLMVTRGQLQKDQIATETIAGITRIYNKETDNTMGYNFHSISDYIKLEGSGQVRLSDEQLDTLNQLLYEKGFETISTNNDPAIVVGYVKSCVDHEDSDHLHITETQVGEDQTYQIVCGAANVHQDMKVVVALPGAVMPDGLVIWPSELRGVQSSGMLCSAYELGVDPEHKLQGIIEIKDDVPIGTPFSELDLSSLTTD
ncbi:YtpR family tRNA-binding protein [Aerococcus sanguinicola]|uniref:YtpR family tRNA-binding protein n=1 Tax=unclassified Aerococcus TaxID=2618060 RepID=UPI0008A479A5|nr:MULTISPECIES: DUF4479 and tRNA-binding domain-containing protein [unclassified Aerococcus]KAB0645915.1 DUF4479 domain-containing protein [Aerococcus sanguinicola]MDK6234182.1 DUF4479 and tRNA-binding domain-containing protein [Aerococcus sp. UMB10185]MDK6805054.1 DUF4479 and tRNA-binding domain-containing protein [Aerococcus sp. UMB7834]MDK6856226.1 DUF4479 and tRNA-binding domain-containing protein [Aerococcus sp. UMB7533]MDK8503000.1 DUF4479 and tRNA-binding domain-containing protein [Aer